MSESGFDDDDLSLTLARFAGKRRNIVHDESRLKRKKPEPISLSSATNACGAAVLAGVANILTVTPQRRKQNEEWSERWEEEREEWSNRDRQWYENNR